MRTQPFMRQNGRGAAAPPYADAQALVETVYLAVFRRPVDPESLAIYVSGVADGRLDALQLLTAFASSEEFHAFSLGPLRYSQDEDPLLAPFRTPTIMAESMALQASCALDEATFVARLDARFGAAQSNVHDYPHYHGRRFLEMFNAAKHLLQGRTAPHILEVGAGPFTDEWSSLFPGARLTLVDRPAVDVFADAHLHVAVDLNLEVMPGVDVVGEQDLIIYTEVLEHLQRSAAHQIGGLLRLLGPEGRLYLTTPNVFRYGALAAIAWRRNPQPPLPASNADGHYHVREYCMSELLQAVEEAGGLVCSWHFSDCWDKAALPPDERGNLVVTARRRPAV